MRINFSLSQREIERDFPPDFTLNPPTRERGLKQFSLPLREGVRGRGKRNIVSKD
jgi:hypothetical protein